MHAIRTGADDQRDTPSLGSVEGVFKVADAAGDGSRPCGIGDACAVVGIYQDEAYIGGTFDEDL